MWIKLSTIPGSIYIFFLTLYTFLFILVRYSSIFMGLLAATIGGDCLWHNEAYPIGPMIDIFYSTYKRTMIIMNTITTMINLLLVSYNQ